MARSGSGFSTLPHATCRAFYGIAREWGKSLAPQKRCDVNRKLPSLFTPNHAHCSSRSQFRFSTPGSTHLPLQGSACAIGRGSPLRAVTVFLHITASFLGVPFIHLLRRIAPPYITLAAMFYSAHKHWIINQSSTITSIDLDGHDQSPGSLIAI